jgi:hypothetical protein
VLDDQFAHFSVEELKQQPISQSHLSGDSHVGRQSVVVQPHVVQQTAFAPCMHVGSHTLVEESGALASVAVVVQTFETQVEPEPQVPQSSTALQPSEMRPQFLPWSAHVVWLVHVPAPQRLAVLPPPQVSVPEQSPQCRLLPQPSTMSPQVLF